MPSLSRFRAALNYLGAADTITRWRVEAARCPLCGPSRFLILGPSAFLARCLKCKANATNLSIIKVIQQNPGGIAINAAYEMSTYGATYDFLKRNSSTFESSEYFPGQPLGESIAGVRNEDAQQLTFRDEAFDIITSNQVFEHVPDDLKCFKECRRTLRPGGSLMFTVPLYDTLRTEQVAELHEGKIRWLLEPEFHASRMTGGNSVPVFWRFSVNDIAERVYAAGFRTAAQVKVVICSRQHEPQIVLQAVK